MPAATSSATLPRTAGVLSPEQLERFDRDGYLVVEGFFDDGDLQPAIDEIEAEVRRRAAELVAQGKLSRTYDGEGFERQLAKISAETDAVAKSIWNGTLCGPAFFNLIRNPKLLDLAESFCGPEIIASSVYRLRPKIPNHPYGAVPWHQDSGYMEAYCDKAMILTVWLPLVDATRENGCMWVIPGAHKTGAVVKHGYRKNQPYLVIPEAELPAREPVCVPVKKGGALFLHNLTPHASFDNSTETVRWSMDLRYQSAALPTNAKISRLPGEDVPSPGGVAPISCYPPEADFLVRSSARPDEVVREAKEFQRIRREHLGHGVTPRWSLLG
ncbi:MAG: phytanoyl-CoA dioxygenase family protein [Planctomycetota bacterium]|nr:phytanoyl-CoA dioxygenase family protein [Planctomycetota bacterium]